jgi:hypothetical protein
MMIKNLIAIWLCVLTLSCVALGNTPLSLFFLMLQIIYMIIVLVEAFR